MVTDRVENLAEPEALRCARRRWTDAAVRIRDLETKESDASQRLSEYQPQPVWRRLLWPSSDHGKQNLEHSVQKFQRQISAARRDLTSAKHNLNAEERKFAVAKAVHEKGAVTRQVQARGRIAMTREALKLLDRNPRLAWGGVASILRMAATAQIRRDNLDLDGPEDWSLVPIFDLWGKPYLPPPPRL